MSIAPGRATCAMCGAPATCEINSVPLCGRGTCSVPIASDPVRDLPSTNVAPFASRPPASPLWWFVGALLVIAAAVWIYWTLDSYDDRRHARECALHWKYARTAADSLRGELRCGLPRGGAG